MTKALLLFASLWGWPNPRRLRGGELPNDPKQKVLGSLKASGIEIDVSKREVRMEAMVCLDDGILEYLVCLENTFEHETVFSTKCRPTLLHAALLLMGFVPNRFDPRNVLWWQSALEKKQSRVNIEVEFGRRGERVRTRIADLLLNRQDRNAKIPNTWVFTGSAFFKEDGKNRYAADRAGIVVGILPNGSSVVQFAEETGDPYQGDTLGLEANPNTIPAVGTKVKLIFTPYAEAAAAADGKSRKARAK